jgi:hypothetical protein
MHAAWLIAPGETENAVRARKINFFRFVMMSLLNG